MKREKKIRIVSFSGLEKKIREIIEMNCFHFKIYLLCFNRFKKNFINNNVLFTYFNVLFKLNLKNIF